MKARTEARTVVDARASLSSMRRTAWARWSRSRPHRTPFAAQRRTASRRSRCATPITGTCMYYTRMAAEQGCIMMLMTNGGQDRAHRWPWKIIGTNPWSVRAGGQDPPFMMDMANTGVACSKDLSRT